MTNSMVLIFGGKSPEHEISLRSANTVYQCLKSTKTSSKLIYIDKSGRWNFLLESIDEINLKDLKKVNSKIVDINIGKNSTVFTSGDVIFPVLHGALYEDGSIQGFLNTCNLPFIGCDVAASAICMNKYICKLLLSSLGVNCGEFKLFRKSIFNNKELYNKAIEGLKYPLFVKPCNLGSSIGVNKAIDQQSLYDCLKQAFEYDDQVIVEKEIIGREIEMAVLENIKDYWSPIVSVPGEVIPDQEIYSFESKYSNSSESKISIPAELEEKVIKNIQSIAKDIFNNLNCQGLARVDGFVDSENNFIFNEVNTLPGFTSISMYPKLMENSGIQLNDLIDRLANLAIKKHSAKNSLKR